METKRMSATMPRPFRPVKPGELLQEELDARGWTQGDLAAILDRPVQAVNEIIAGKKAITPETAVALSRALGTSAEYWLRLDSLYRLDQLHQRSPQPEQDISRRARTFAAAPVKELIKRGWLTVPNPKDPVQLERAVCDFLGTKSIDERPSLAFAARQGKSGDPQTASVVAWVCHVHSLARKQKVSTFNPAHVSEAAKTLPQISAKDNGAAGVRQRLAEIGIRFVVAEHLPNTRVDGAAFWLDPRAPVVALSLRYDRIDYFWFTLMHELAHIASSHAKDRPRIDDALVGRDSEPASEKQAEEKHVDGLASEWLVPAHRLAEFVTATSPYFYRARVLEFAQSLGVHPGIVVGRLQHEGHVPWTHLRNLLERVRPQLAGAAA